MNITGKAVLVALGLAASAFVSAVPASAQYYDRGYDRGYGRSDRYDRGYEGRRDNLEAQKRAIRAQREAQQRRPVQGGGYGRGGFGGGGNNGPGGGFVVVPGPRGSYAVPTGPSNEGHN